MAEQLEREQGQKQRKDGAGAEASGVFGTDKLKKDEKEPKAVADKMDHFEKKGFTFARGSKFIEEYERERFLGQGAFSKVWLYKHRVTAKKRAVKIMEKRLCTSDQKMRYKKEIYMLKALEHPNIVKVREYWEDAERIYVCFEFLKGNELFCQVNEKAKAKARYTEK